jgi:hypothetical protein
MQACACTSRSSRALKAAAELHARVCACVRVCAGGVCHREAGFSRQAMHTAHPAKSEVAHFPRPLPCANPCAPRPCTSHQRTTPPPSRAKPASPQRTCWPAPCPQRMRRGPLPPRRQRQQQWRPARPAGSPPLAPLPSRGPPEPRGCVRAAAQRAGHLVCVCVFVDGDRGGRGGGSSSRARREHGHARGTQRRRTCSAHSPPSSLHTSASIKPARWPRHQPTPSHAVRLTCACEVAR